ncbi:unnamed protein product [Adineta steineri]|uniref:Uncharacterized protein n=1 Tax=Adineta steineri TaxID=433720 RepID=A0A813SII1_9BILA|nr:unnamed protein product [Adineta steineri]CAF0827304.1 unnamed protein product [Adineta steineri]CAF3520585.1 unnamed protein product [Adineta steineri]CAF3821590.1 unnamed protein product [Adineta steineri]
MINKSLNQTSTNYDHLSVPNTQMRTINNNNKIPNGIRAKSADSIRTKSTIMSTSRSTITDINEHYRKNADNEKNGLTILNNRFENYLNQIKNLADKNIDLRHQIDAIYQTHMEHNENDKSPEIETRNLRQKLNNELRQFLSCKIRLQRADHDKKYYRNKLQYFSTSEQEQLIKQKLNGDIYELDFLKEQYGKKQNDLQSIKIQYNEYLAKIAQYTNEYYNIIYDRMTSESSIHTLNEHLLFEREYKKRCEQEFKSLEKIQDDFNNHFNKTELENTIKMIRQDYQKYNESQLIDLEKLYKIKLHSIQKEYHHYTTNEYKHESKNEDFSEELIKLTQQNQFLQQQLKKLENNHYQTNQQQHEILNQEYYEVENQVSEYQSLIEYSRDNTNYLSLEINTYQCLLINLVSSTQQKTNLLSSKIPGFNIYFDHGTMWVRI